MAKANKEQRKPTFPERRKAPNAIEEAISKKKIAPVVIPTVVKKIDVGIEVVSTDVGGKVKPVPNYYCHNNETLEVWYMQELIPFYLECFKEDFGGELVGNLEEINFTNTEVKKLFKKLAGIEDAGMIFIDACTAKKLKGGFIA